MKALRDETRAARRSKVLELREAERGTCEATKATARAELGRTIEAVGRELEQQRTTLSGSTAGGAAALERARRSAGKRARQAGAAPKRS